MRRMKVFSRFRALSRAGGRDNARYNPEAPRGDHLGPAAAVVVESPAKPRRAGAAAYPNRRGPERIVERNWAQLTMARAPGARALSVLHASRLRPKRLSLRHRIGPALSPVGRGIS